MCCYRCLLCGFDVELDDVVVASAATGRCVCLRCFCREVADVRRMSDEARRALIDALYETPELT